LRRLILQRLAVLPFVVLGISALVFFISRLIPGDPAVVFAGGRTRATPAMVAAIRHQWGLDRPLLVQYVKYVGRLAHGDFGYSNLQQASVVTLVMRRLPASIEVTGIALIIGVPIGLYLGVRSAWKQGSLTDHAANLLSITGIALPLFWAPLLFIYLFSVQLGWLPISGRLPAFSAFHGITGIYSLDALIRGDFADFWTILRHLILPSATLAIIPAAILARFGRAIFLDVLGENYIRTAHAYGIRPRTILWKLAGKNAMLPLITLITLLIPALIVGGVLVESIFSWPGVGQFLLSSLNERDYVVIQSLTLMVGLLYVVLNLIADMSYAILDPRTRRS
jgi:ABC-type dipeptide/oligopeptide/nickel transport system permease component